MQQFTFESSLTGFLGDNLGSSVFCNLPGITILALNSGLELTCLPLMQIAISQV